MNIYNKLFKTKETSPESQRWVDDVLEESNITIENPYKVVEDDYWRTTHNTIHVKKNYEQDNPELNKFILKHEVKHLKNKDTLKSAPLYGTTVGLATFIMGRKPIFTVPVILAGYSMNMAYWKYYEGEADRFAYEHSNRKEIETAQQYFLNKRQTEINNVLDLDDAIHSIEHKLNKPLSYYDMIKEKTRLNFFKTVRKNPEISVDILEFINDREHPSNKNRAAMAQQYIDQWEETYK